MRDITEALRQAFGRDLGDIVRLLDLIAVRADAVLGQRFVLIDRFGGLGFRRLGFRGGFVVRLADALLPGFFDIAFDDPALGTRTIERLEIKPGIFAMRRANGDALMRSPSSSDGAAGASDLDLELEAGSDLLSDASPSLLGVSSDDLASASPEDAPSAPLGS
ncbi:dihydrolipoamide acetyltransferase [Oceanicaulis sp. HTCC2633]|nr:dihydrolipoamide acetyltransferase [Oceanicaulis sp. HTCC2633]